LAKSAFQSDQSTVPPNNLKGMIRAHPLFFYFLIAYAFTWSFFTVEILSTWNILPNNSDLLVVVNTLATFGPAVSGIIVVGMLDGKNGLLRMRDRIRLWKVGWKWLAFIFLGIPLMFMFGVGVLPGAFVGFLGVTAIALVRYPFYYFGIWFGGGPLGEEIGWRGFALPRMQPIYGALKATALLGTLWACWHLPQFLTPYQGGGPGTGFATFITNFSTFFLLVMSLAFIFTWIFNHTKGSIFAAISAHASVDTPQLALLPLFPAVGVTGMNVGALIGFGIPALLILLLTRGQLGYQSNRSKSVLLRSQ